MSNSINVLQHNLSSMFSNRQLGITTGIKAKSSEKLASGYKINRAADDAAGLSISEKMRRQIRGLQQGSKNITEGIELIKTAEGALNEVHDMLQRMNELTIKGVNGTLSHDDRAYIQYEIDHLYEEIARTSATTTYNEIPLLQGNPWVEHVVGIEEEEVIHVDVVKMPDQMPADYVTFGTGNTMQLNGASDGGSVSQPIDDGTGVKALDENGNVITNDADIPKAKAIVENNQWSSSLSDNFGTYLDFSALAKVKGSTTLPDGKPGVSNLYAALQRFAGTGFYTTCNTCNREYKILFTDDRGQYVFRSDQDYDWKTRTYGDEKGATVKVDLSELLKRAEKATSESDAQAITRDLVGLIKSTISHNEKFQDHYTRFTTNDADPYKLFIYDFRDYLDPNDSSTDKSDERFGYIVSEPDNEKGLGKIGNLSGQLIIRDMEVRATNITWEGQEPLNIQHGVDAPNNSKINLPDLMSIFEVYKEYGYNSVKQSLTLEERIKNRTVESLAHELGQTMGTMVKKTRYIPAKEAYDQEEKVLVPANPPRVPVNGEWRKNPPIWTTKTVHYEAQPARTETWWESDTSELERQLASRLGVEEEQWGDINFSMIGVVKNLIQQVSEMRSDLGAQQNRLEHAYAQNRNNEENTMASESRIRDADMSDEMVRFSNASIIQQAGQSMLAQANQSSQGILSLIQ